MHTRCTHCDTAFRITPEVLSYARGRVRCGQCLRTFDALEHLSEEAGNILIAATPGAQKGNPDLDGATQYTPEDEEDAFNVAQASPESEYDGSELEVAAQDRPEDEEDTFSSEFTSSESEYDTPEEEEAAQDIVDEEEEYKLYAEPTSTETMHDALEVEVAALEADQDTSEDEEDNLQAQQDTFAAEGAISEVGVNTFNTEPASSGTEGDALEVEVATLEADQDTSEDEEDNLQAQQDPFAAEGAISEVGVNTFNAEPASSGTEIDTPEAAALDVGQNKPEDREDTAGDEPVTCSEEEETFEKREVFLADEDDTLDGELDLDATNSWKLDEELLNTSTLPALPGLVEHPEYAELQQALPEPVVSTKPRPDMNWDDSWDDMSFDDEHGIPLMEDLEEIAETEDQAAVITNHSVERIWFDPATNLTEADLPQSGADFMRQGQASPEPLESTPAHPTDVLQEPAGNVVAELVEPVESTQAHLTDALQEPAGSDAAESVDPLESTQAHLTDALQDPTDSDVAESVEPLESTQAHLTDSLQDPTDSDVAELVEAIENAANMFTGTGGESFESNAANLRGKGPAGIPEAVPVADLTEVQAELERLALLVGIEPGEIAPDAAKPQATENFEHIVRKRRSGWGLAATALLSLALAIVFGAQLVHYYRADLLTDATWGPMMRQTYALLGIELPPDWELDRYDIRQLGGIQDPARPGVLVISLSVRNQASRAQPYPVIRLVLEDRWGDRLAMRDLKPADYLDSGPVPGAMMLAGQLIKTDISIIEPEGANATTFQVDACIENPRGHLDCANQL